MKSRITLAFTSLVVFVITEINWGQLRELKRSYNSSLIEPVSYLALGIFITSIILLCFSDAIFKKWLRNVALWYFPLALVIVVSGSTGSSYAWISRGDLAALMGALLVAVTLVFALTQRFYYKVT